nr:hypothetical protein [Neorhizobium galegae]
MPIQALVFNTRLSDFHWPRLHLLEPLHFYRLAPEMTKGSASVGLYFGFIAYTATMFGPHTFDLAFAASRQFGGASDAISARPQCHNPLVCRRVRLSVGVFAIGLGLIDTLKSSRAICRASLSNISCTDSSTIFYALRVGRDLAQIDNAGQGKPCAFSADRCNELFGFRQWQTANAIDLFRDHDFARLKVRDQPQQLRPIGPSTRGFFAIDSGDVIPGRPGVVDDRLLSPEDPGN